MDDITSGFSDFMDDYGMAIGMGSQAVGTMMRRRALERVRQEQERMRAVHAARQRAIQEQIAAEQAKLLPKLTAEATEAQRQGIAQQYEQYMAPKAAVADAGEYSAGVASAPTEVKERAERELAEARKKGAAYSKNLANLTSYGGLNAAQNATIGTSGTEIRRLQDASQGWSSLLPAQLEGAYARGQDYMTASDIANGIGSISFMYGATAPRRKPKPKPKPENSFDIYEGDYSFA